MSFVKRRQFEIKSLAHHRPPEGDGGFDIRVIEGRVTLQPNGQVAGHAPPARFRLFTLGELSQQPPTEWLIERLIERGSLMMLYGAPGEGKSFAALDWALCVATGTEWQGRPISRGAVVYVAAEGDRGIVKRARAWIQEQGADDPETFFIVREPVQLRDDTELNLLLTQLDGRNIKPALIVLDTFAKCFVGGEENSAKEVGEFIEQARRLQVRTGATVCIVHHSAKKKGQRAPEERGSSALRGAMDTIIRLAKDKGDAIRIDCEKMKDSEEFDPIFLRMKVVEIEGTDLTSCVLVSADADADDGAPSAECFDALRALLAFKDGCAQSGDWWRAIPTPNHEELPETTFHRRRRALVEAGYVEPVEGQRGAYRVTQLGAATASYLPKGAKGSSHPTPAATATTP